MSLPLPAWLAAAVLACWCVGAYNRLMRLRAAAAAAFAGHAEALAARHRLLAERLAAAPPAGGEAASWEAADAALRQSRAAAEHAAARPSDKAVASLALAERVLREALARWTPAPGPVDEVPGPGETAGAAEADRAATDATGGAGAALAVAEGVCEGARERYNAAAAEYEQAAREFPTRIVARVFGFGPAGRL